MTRRKRLLLGLTASVAIGLAIAVLACLFPANGDGITEKNYDKLRKGMTLQEVETTLGVPPGDYSGAAPFWPGMTVKSLTSGQGAPSHVWHGKEFAIGIWVDEAGAVAEKSFVRYADQGEHWGWQPRVRQWLGL